MRNIEDIKDPKYLLRIIEQIEDRLNDIERTPIVQQSLSGSADASPKSCPKHSKNILTTVLNNVQ